VVIAEELESAISGTLSWGQICERHPDEWVCLVEIEHAGPNDVEIVSARVVGHGKTKREPVEQAKVWWTRYSTIGHFYTGTLRAPSPIIRVIVEDEIRDDLRRR
jgi:hypothetical protein